MVNFYSYRQYCFQKINMYSHSVTVKNLHDQKSRARKQLFTSITFAKKIFYYYMRKINTNVRDCARDTYYFFIIFLILALLLAGELSTLIRSFNNPTIIP